MRFAPSPRAPRARHRAWDRLLVALDRHAIEPDAVADEADTAWVEPASVRRNRIVERREDQTDRGRVGLERGQPRAVNNEAVVPTSMKSRRLSDIGESPESACRRPSTLRNPRRPVKATTRGALRPRGGVLDEGRPRLTT